MRTSTTAPSSAPAATLPANTRALQSARKSKHPFLSPYRNETVVISRIQSRAQDLDEVFKGLWKHHKPQITRMVRNVLPDCDAEEVVQAIAVRFWLRIDKYKAERTEFIEWLSNIATKVIKGEQRRLNMETAAGLLTDEEERWRFYAVFSSRDDDEDGDEIVFGRADAEDASAQEETSRHSPN